jgi:phospholipid transport system substrate-binding protein
MQSTRDSCHELSSEQKQTKVRETIEASYDLNVIIRRAIGRNWRLMDESEQTQVLELVKQLVVKAYVKGMDGKSRPQVELGSIIKVTEKRIEIESRVLLDGKTYYVVYRLARLSTGWEIYDIVAENISVVSNYRQQIDDHFRKGTGAELIIRLEELLESEDINENTKI